MTFGVTGHEHVSRSTRWGSRTDRAGPAAGHRDLRPRAAGVVHRAARPGDRQHGDQGDRGRRRRTGRRRRRGSSSASARSRPARQPDLRRPVRPHDRPLGNGDGPGWSRRRRLAACLFVIAIGRQRADPGARLVRRPAGGEPRALGVPRHDRDRSRRGSRRPSPRSAGDAERRHPGRVYLASALTANMVALFIGAGRHRRRRQWSSMRSVLPDKRPASPAARRRRPARVPGTFWVSPGGTPTSSAWISRSCWSGSFLFTTFRFFWMKDEIGLGDAEAARTVATGVLIYTVVPGPDRPGRRLRLRPARPSQVPGVRVHRAVRRRSRPADPRCTRSAASTW